MWSAHSGAPCSTYACAIDTYCSSSSNHNSNRVRTLATCTLPSLIISLKTNRRHFPLTVSVSTRDRTGTDRPLQLKPTPDPHAGPALRSARTPSTANHNAPYNTLLPTTEGVALHNLLARRTHLPHRWTPRPNASAPTSGCCTPCCSCRCPRRR